MEHVSRRRAAGHTLKMTVICAIAVALIVVIRAPASQAKDQGEAHSYLRGLSKAFTDVAQEAMPAVVFIKVEKTLQGGEQTFEFNNPFDLFGQEFFERFFGQRFPQQRREHRQPHQYRQVGQGSGFIISSDGYILTNHHVVGDADKITVTLADNREFKAKLVGSDAKTDLAVIKIDGKNLPVLPRGDSDQLAVGEWVIAIGNPFGLSHTVTVGVVSAKGRSRMGITDYEDFIQTDAAINPGNSGGPLLNLSGQVVGINTAIFTRSGGYMGIGFAIPINMATVIEKQLIATGKVSRGYLGVSIQDLTPDLAKSFGLSGQEGVLVAGVAPKTPAAAAGFKTGDVIVDFDGTAVTDTGQLRNIVAQTPVGQHVKVGIIRDKKPQEMAVTIGEQPAKMAMAMPAPSEPESLEQWGFTAQDLTADLAKQLGYSGEEGAVVTNVEPGSQAEEAGLHRGTLILEVNRQAVHNTEDLMDLLAKAKASKHVLLLVQDRQGTHFLTLSLS
jgi:serine protease Do